jgi:hypothetical protein
MIKMNGKYQRYILQNRKKIGISVVIFIFLIALGIAVVSTKSHSAFTTPSNKIVYVAINGSEDFNCDGSDDQVEINQALAYVVENPQFTTVHLKGPNTGSVAKIILLPF